MPALIDLPSEILTRLPSGYTFLIHGARSQDDQWREDRTTIAALARTCRKLHSVFKPCLYRSVILTSLPIKNRLYLIRSIIAQPELGSCVEDLKLDFFEQKFPLRDASAEFVENMTPEQLNASDGDWYRLLGFLFFPSMSNLRQLAVRCTRYEKIPGEFPELVNAHIRSYCQGRGIGLDAAAVKQLLLAPKIQNLVLSGPYITDTNQLANLEPATSSVATLALRVIMLSPQSLLTLLRLPRKLTSLEFYSAAMRAPFLEARSRDNFISFRDVSAALESQKDNLGTIRICFPSSDAELPTSIFGGLSFHGFPRLTRLSIAPEMVLGWKECIHNNRDADKNFGPPDPTGFVDSLPHCLEDLTIFVQQYQRARNGNGYAYDVVRGILNKRRTFYKLEHLELACCKGVISCDNCRRAAITYLDRSPTVKADEITQIRDSCEQARVRFTWTEGVWEDP